MKRERPAKKKPRCPVCGGSYEINYVGQGLWSAWCENCHKWIWVSPPIVAGKDHEQ